MARYSQKLMEHFNTPRNGGRMDNADVIGQASHNGQAPQTQMYLRFEGRRIDGVTFTTFGCGVSIACCSALTELACGKTVDEGLRICASDVIEALEGVPPDREFCAAIAVAALHDALHTRLGCSDADQLVK